MQKRHYNYSERVSIELMLNDGHSIKEIEKDIKRSSSNIIKEIKKHIILIFPSSFNNSNCCLNHKECNVKCYDCYKTCKNVNYNVCPKLLKSPHVCNGCLTKHGCRFVKKYYDAREAHDEYKLNLCEKRKGLHYSKYEHTVIAERLCPLIIKTKSVYHSVLTINSQLNLSFKVKTIYWQIKKKYLPVSSSDLPRHRGSTTVKVDKSYKRDIENHTYDDYMNFKVSNLNANEIQMDTVEGIKENNAPVILTLEIIKINFLFMFKIDSQTKTEVINKLIYFKKILGSEIFDMLFEILLTDNGKEFFILDEIENISSKIHLFYCHPYSSYEKGSIENNHEFIRRVIPKGVSLKPYTQEDLNILCSHVNSLLRESLDGKCPFDLIDKYIPRDKIKMLGLSKINSLDVCLIPELLGEKNINNIKKYLDEKDIQKANIKFLNNQINNDLKS